MKIFCLEEFKAQFEKLISKRSYRNLEGEIINYFFGKDVSALMNGTRLNNSNETPYIKKRLNGSGGYRTYYLLVIKDDSLYLMFVHPKTGSLGASNITDESKSALYKIVLEAIRDNNLYEMEVKSGKLNFKKI
jgi:hypothetical protein